MQPTFKDILEKKLNSPLEEDTLTPLKSQFSDPFALSFLMGTIPQYRYQANFYKQNRANSNQFNNQRTQEQSFKKSNFSDKQAQNKEQNIENISSRKKERIFKLNELKPESMAAVYVLKSLGAIIDEQFDLTGLKKQYRRLLLQYHPDLASTDTCPDHFHSLQIAYECILSELRGT